MITIKLDEYDAEMLKYYLIRSYLLIGNLDINQGNLCVINPVGDEALCGNPHAQRALLTRNKVLNMLDGKKRQEV